MPVGTDAILLASWVNLEKSKKILDVGTGSGVVAMIMAHRSAEARIDAIDSSSEAAALAEKNFLMSPFSHRLNPIQADWRDFAVTGRSTYDIVVSNPPFFERSLDPAKESRRRWRHVSGLGFNSLLQGGKDVLVKDGRINMIIPFRESDDVIEAARSFELQLRRYCQVIPVSGRPANRIMLELSWSEEDVGPMEKTSLTLRGVDGQYHTDYLALAGSYYLKPLK